jgi:hypothetical protein
MINDPGIVQVFDVGYLPDGRAYLVMERLRGETLAQRQRSRGFQIDQTVQLLRLIARTLDAAHSHQIVHRDLKPDNIFLVRDRDVPGGERVKILDFGIAKLANASSTMQATRAGAIFGTPAYMAPEQCNDTALVDARADLYAVGCIAYEMLSGQPPFGYGGIELLAAHMRDQPMPMCQRNPSVPPWLGNVVDKLLQKSPSDRYLSAADLFGALDPAAPQFVAPTAYSMPPAPSASRATPQPYASYPQQGSNPPVHPSYAPPQPQMTTHGAASGVVTQGTLPPTAKGKLVLLVSVIAAIAAAVVITIVVMSKQRGDAKASKQIIDDVHQALVEERWDDAERLAQQVTPDDKNYNNAQRYIAEAKLEREAKAAYDGMLAFIAENKLPEAKQQLAAINPASKLKAKAQLDYERALAAKQSQVAIAETKPETKPETRPETKPATKPTTKPATKPKDPAKDDDDDSPSEAFDTAISKARDAAEKKNWGAALRAARSAAKSARTGIESNEARMIGTKAACALGNSGVAAKLIPPASSGSYHSIAREFCRNRGVPLD